MAGKLSITWFKPEELHLMKLCLEAIACDTYVQNSLVPTLTGLGVTEFKDVADRFDTIPAFDSHDFYLIERAVNELSGYPVDFPKELETFLGIRLLYLKWFADSLRATQAAWDELVEQNQNHVRIQLEGGNPYGIDAEILRNATAPA